MAAALAKTARAARATTLLTTGCGRLLAYRPQKKLRASHQQAFSKRSNLLSCPRMGYGCQSGQNTFNLPRPAASGSRLFINYTCI